MSTWEERMSAKTKARATVAEAEEIAREAARVDALRASNPPVHEDETGPTTHGEHAGHYTHWTPAHGNTVMCSCGNMAGVFTIGVDSDAPPLPRTCTICEARGIQPG